MKFYKLNTVFTFGKFKGKTLKEVITIQPSYVEWCLVNLDHFYISDKVLKEIKQIRKNFYLSEEAEAKRREKFDEWKSNRKKLNQENNREYNHEREYKYKSPFHYDWSEEELRSGDWDYDPTNPAHDPSENPWIDVFGPNEEAEIAYWNTN